MKMIKKAILIICVGCGMLMISSCDDKKDAEPTAYCGNYYLNGEINEGNEFVTISDSQFSFVNYNPDVYFEYLLPALEGTDYNEESYKKLFLDQIANPYSYTFTEQDGKYYVRVQDFDGTGEATLKVQYSETKQDARLLIMNREFICNKAG